MKISIVIPTCSRIDFLEKALKSINSQTYRDYEVIIVNDNPADKSRVDELASTFEKTTVIHHAATLGGNAARNSGILNSAGEIITFLDDDDIWLPEKLARHAQAHIQQPNTGLVFSDCLYVYNNPMIADRVASSYLPVDVVNAMQRARFCPATTSIVSVKRECVEKCGLFDENLVSFQDWDYWFRLAHHFEFSHLPEILVHYTQHLQTRTSINEDKRKKGMEQICSKWGREINTETFLKKFKHILYYNSSMNALLAGETLTAISKSMRLFNKEVIGKKSVLSFLSLLVSLFFITREPVVTSIKQLFYGFKTDVYNREKATFNFYKFSSVFSFLL